MPPRTGLALILPFLGCGTPEPTLIGTFEVRPSAEDVLEDGSRFTSSTQSFLRGHHALDRVNAIGLTLSEGLLATASMTAPDGAELFRFDNIPVDQLVPRLHYSPSTPPDAFDAFNLMMAEYSRNGLSMPIGQPGDSMAHFETPLAAEQPWSLAGDYTFEPDPEYRPYRASVINNCLAPGLWELSAKDRSGEVYHGWFTLDVEAYTGLVAQTNSLPTEFVQSALTWSVEEPRLSLDRLRTVVKELGTAPLVPTEPAQVGYSSQDSRRKLQRGFVSVEEEGELHPPETLDDLNRLPVHMVEFLPPGTYSSTKRRRFDLGMLGRPADATVRLVRPSTSYSWRTDGVPDHQDADHLEFELPLGDLTLVLGNLPMPLLVQQEDYVLHGFGVGVLPSSSPAERRRFLIDGGPAPGYAYLARAEGDGWRGVNSHEHGIEQVFVRTRPFEDPPHWEVTITSYERIVDLAKYRLEIPPSLLDAARGYSEHYVSPLYYTYTDDNLR